MAVDILENLSADPKLQARVQILQLNRRVLCLRQQTWSSRIRLRHRTNTCEFAFARCKFQCIVKASRPSSSERLWENTFISSIVCRFEQAQRQSTPTSGQPQSVFCSSVDSFIISFASNTYYALLTTTCSARTFLQFSPVSTTVSNDFYGLSTNVPTTALSGKGR